MFIVLVKLHAGDLGRCQCSLNQQLRIVCPVDDINILILQFTNDTMDPASFHTHTSTNRIDTIVEGLYGHFSSLARITNDLFNYNKTIEYFGNLDLQQFGEKVRRSS